MKPRSTSRREGKKIKLEHGNLVRTQLLVGDAAYGRCNGRVLLHGSSISPIGVFSPSRTDIIIASRQHLDTENVKVIGMPGVLEGWVGLFLTIHLKDTISCTLSTQLPVVVVEYWH